MPGTENGERSIVFSTYIKNTLPEQLERIGKQSEKPAEKAFEKVGKKMSDSIEKPIEDAQKSIDKLFERSKTLKSVKTEEHFEIANNAIDLMNQKLGNVISQMGQVESKLLSVEEQYKRVVEQEGDKSQNALTLDSEATNLQAKLISLQSTAISTQEKIDKAIQAPIKAAEKAAQARAKAEEQRQNRIAKAAEKALQERVKAEERAERNALRSAEKIQQANQRAYDNIIKQAQSAARQAEQWAAKSASARNKSASRAARHAVKAYQKQAAACQVYANKYADAQSDASDKAAKAVEKAQRKAQKAAEKASKASSKAVRKMAKDSSHSASSMGKAFEKVGKTITRSLKAVFVTAVLYKFFKAFKDNITGAMSKNKEFAKSLNAIKANLSVAFTPIIEAVMPLITRLAQGIATVTKYIATFIAAIFGKTYKQAVNSTKKLQGEAKKAQASTSRDFDELHNVDKDDEQGSSGTDFSALDTSQLNTGPMQKFQEILEKIRGTLEVVSPAFKNLYEKGIKPVVQWLGGKLKDAFQFLGKQLSKVGDWFVKHKESFSKLGDSLGRLWKVLEPIFNAAWDGLKIAIGGVFDGFLSAAGSILDILPSAVDFVTALFTGDWETLKEKGKEIVEGWWKGIKERWETVKETAKSLFSRFIDLIKEVFEIHSPSTVFADIGKNLIQGLIDGIKNIWENLTSTVTEKLDKFKTLVKDKFTSAKDNALGAFDKLKTGLKEKCDSIWSSLKEFINKVLGGIENMINKPVNALNTLIRKLNSLNINVPEILGGGTIGFNIGEFSQVSIPKLARGGLVSKPTLSLIGEAGKEAVVPLEHNTGWMDGMKEIIINAILTAHRMTEIGQRNTQSQSQVQDLVFNIDGKTFARIIFDLIAKYGSSKDLTLGVW